MISVVYSTVATLEEARNIAYELVNSRFVACVNIVPKIESIYRWQGKIEQNNEVLLLAKTIDKKVPQVITKIKQHHSYEVPDIISFPITTGLKEYLTYVEDETQ